MLLSRLKKVKVNTVSSGIFIFCVIATLFILVFPMNNKGDEPYKNPVNTLFLSKNKIEELTAFDLGIKEPIIDLKYLSDNNIYALTFENPDILTVFFLKNSDKSSVQRFSVFLNEEEDYCGLTLLNSGGYAFTTTGRVIWLNEFLMPQSEFLFPSSISGDIEFCELSPPGAELYYVINNEIHICSTDFSDDKIIYSLKNTPRQIINMPVWEQKAEKLFFLTEDENLYIYLEEIEADGNNNKTIMVRDENVFADLIHENAYFFEDDYLQIVPLDGSQMKKIELNSRKAVSFIPDGKGHILIKKEDDRIQNMHYLILDHNRNLEYTAFITPMNITAPSEPMDISENGFVAAQIESAEGGNTGVFIKKILE